MTPDRRSFLRSLMVRAWAAYREEPARAFADCLRGAWRAAKRMAAFTASKANPFRRNTTVHLKPVFRSPIDDACGSDRRHAAFKAAHLTARIGR